MERTLKQLEKYISGMTEADREAAVRALKDLFAVLRRYKVPITAGAVLQIASSAGVAHAAGTVDKWWARLCAKAQETGPYVGAIFQAV